MPADPPIKDWIEEAVDFLARTHNGDDIDFEFDQDTVWSLAPVAPPIEPSNPVVGQFDSIWLGPSQLPNAGVFHRRSVDGGASAAFFGTLPNAILADAFDS